MRVVSGVYRAREERRINRLLCESEGIDPQAFEADRRWWEARLRQAGAVTMDEQVAFVADELGVPIAEVEATAREIAETRRLLGG
jgi:hypothetical protein